MRTYGFGIIGCGAISALHVNAIQSLPDARLVAVTDMNEARAKEFALTYGCEAVADVDALLARADVDVVAICVPNHLHMRMGIRAAEAGKNVIVEKPLALNTADADALISACEKANVKLMGVFQRRFDPDIALVKRMIDDGYIGKLLHATCRVMWYREQSYYDASPFHGRMEFEGGGVLMNQAIHHIDLLQWLAGPVKSLFARVATVGHEQIDVEDSAVATLTFENGALGVIEATTCAWPGPGAQLELYGADGSIRLNDGKLVAACHKNKEWTLGEYEFNPVGGDGAKIVLGISDTSHGALYASFIEALRTGGKPPVDGREAKAALAIIGAIYASAKKNAPVDL